MLYPMRNRRAYAPGPGIRPLLLCSLLVCAIPVGALQVEARLDASVVQQGRPVRLMLEMDGKPEQAPDLQVLERDFRIVGRHGSSSRTSINGQVRERYRMVLTLVPRRTGVLEIPPLRFADTETAPLHLAVAEAAAQPAPDPAPAEVPDALPAPPPTRVPSLLAPVQPAADSDIATDAPVLLEVSVEPTQVRVAQQAVLIARVLMPRPLTAPFLHEPQAGGASLLPLGENWDRITRDGIDYGVYERRYALFPRETGRLEIAPLIFEAWAPPDADQQPKPLRVSSESLTLQALPAVDIPPGASWLPARDVRLTEIAPEIFQIRVDQSLERVVDLRADGIAAADLPALTSSAPPQHEAQHSLEGLWDEHTPEGIIGTRRERIRLTAREPGRYRLPAISLNWWDTDKGNWRSTALPARDLIVLAADTHEPPAPSLFEPPDETVDTWTQAPSAVMPQTEQAPSPLASPGTQRDGTAASSWPWIALALAAAWLLTMAAWWGSRRREEAANRGTKRQAESNPPALQRSAAPDDPMVQAIDHVRYAYESGEAGAAREALLAWAALALPEQTPGNLALLAKRCREPLRSEILLLEQAFFSPQPLQWERRRVWERLPGFEPIPPQEPASFRRKKPLRRRTSPPDAVS